MRRSGHSASPSGAPVSLPTSPAPVTAHAEAFRSVCLARYVSRSLSKQLAEHHLARAGDDERLVLRMRLLLLRFGPRSPGQAPHYAELAERMRALGDNPGDVIARSYALLAQSEGCDAAASLVAYDRLAPEIDGLADPLERHVAMAVSLFLAQAAGHTVLYMQQACRLLHLAEEIGHAGLRSAALSNLGIAFYLAGDDLQARHHLEQSLECADLGGWLRFSAVALLAEVYVCAGELEKALPLIRAWALPQDGHALDGLAVAHFHALGAETYARLGHVSQAQACLDFLAAMPAESRVPELGCMLGVVRALLHQAAGDAAQAQAELADALAQAQHMPGGPHAVPPRFWNIAADVASAQSQWQRACEFLMRGRHSELTRRREGEAVRRAAVQWQTDASARAIEAAQRDPLTGLGNRERLIAVGDRWLAMQLAPVVVKLNVRRFNAINEALGRETGDAVLQAVAQRLREACSRFEHAQAARLYADQFAIVAAGGLGGVEPWSAVAAELFATPLAVAGHWVDISAAWGVAQGPADGASMQRLLSHAEIALNEDRRTQAGWTVYAPSLVRADPRQLSLISELKRAARQDEFFLVLQPKFRLADHQVVSFESLVRWEHPTRGAVQPAHFIPFAEGTGAIKGVTAWVLRRAMALSCRLRAEGLVSEIAVNVSVHDVADAAFVPLLRDLLASTGAQAHDIRLELTEGAVMRDPATVIDRMRDINALGFEWSIDDFGTGQSSLAYLNMLPVSELKIDRSFVKGAAASPASLTLLKAAIDLGRNLGLSTVGEGAETAEEWHLLRQLGCGVAQGWFGSRPLPEQGLLPWLKALRSG